MSQSALSDLLRLRRTAIVVAVATAVAVMAPIAATAGVATTPTITAPADGATVVSSPMLVSADSGAAFVRFVVLGQVERTVAVSGGSAVTEIPVTGLSGGASLDAYDCDSSVSCAATPASINVLVDLNDPVIIAPERNNVVGNSVAVKARTVSGGALR
ncbi:MAG: hypothetical protein ABI720_06630, partial [Actinomycetes bacterium]